MPTIGVRLTNDEVENLDALVDAIDAYYKRRAGEWPAIREVETTRSSALRDLLSAWMHRINATEEFRIPQPSKEGAE